MLDEILEELLNAQLNKDEKTVKKLTKQLEKLGMDSYTQSVMIRHKLLERAKELKNENTL